MNAPYLSVIVPAYNEAGRIGATLDQLGGYLATQPFDWEVIVADDGSSDATAQIVRRHGEDDARIRLLQLPHRGKGWAVRKGMLESRGEWRFMCDADLSMPPEHITRFLPSDSRPHFDIGIGSREAPGAHRIHEPARRHLIGRLYNWIARMVAVPGVSDTQCGFKMYRGELASDLFSRQTIDGFGFDVEVLFLARESGARMQEVAIDWHYHTESRVGLLGGLLGFIDIFRVRWNELRGKYR